MQCTAFVHDPDDIEAKNDSDVEGSSSSMERSIQSARNAYSLENASLEIKLCHDDVNVGVGLYATQTMKKGVDVPAKGPVFNSTQEAAAFAAKLPGARWNEKVVKLEHKLDTTRYKVLTGIVGFVNHFEGRSEAANCVLIPDPCRGWDENLIVLRTLRQVRKGQELLISYGQEFNVETTAEGEIRMAGFAAKEKNASKVTKRKVRGKKKAAGIDAPEEDVIELG